MAPAILQWLDRPIINPFHRSKADEFSPENNASRTVASNKVDENGVQYVVPHKQTGFDAEAGEEADENVVTSAFQHGVKKAEAITLTWTPTALYCTYAWFVCSCAILPFSC